MIIDPNGPEFQLGQTLAQLQTMAYGVGRGETPSQAALQACLADFIRLIHNVGQLRAECNKRGELLKEAAGHIRATNQFLQQQLLGVT